MKILDLDRKKGLINLAIENIDDLWHLYNVIHKEDTVYARTTREIKTRDSSGQVCDSRRIPLTLGLKVTDVFFDSNMNRLRIRGKVIDIPDKFEDVRSSYHTISVQPNSTLKLVKENLTDYHLKRIYSASKVQSSPIIVIAIDDEEACIAEVRRFNVNVKYESLLKLPGKREAEKRRDAEKSYFANMSKAFLEVLKKVKGRIVIIGPGFLKDRFASYVRENLKLKDIHVASVSSAGLSGVNEAIRSGILLKIVKENRFLEEAQLVETFFAKLAFDEKMVAYGSQEIEAATKYGAVEKLMIVDKFLREASGDILKRLEELMREVEEKNGKIIILSGEHEAGEKITSLGGAAAFLRFRIQ